MKAALVLAGYLFFVSAVCACLAQDRPAGSDPVVASLKAEGEGHLVDAENIILDAVHKAESSEPNSPQLALYFKRLAVLRERKEQYTEALDFLQRARGLDEKAFGPTDKSVVGDMAAIGSILHSQGKLGEAEQILKEALHITNPELATSPERTAALAGLASVYASEDRLAEAEWASKEALDTCESHPSKSSGTCDSYRWTLANIYRANGRSREADQMPINTYLPAELANLNNQARHYDRDGLLAQAEASYRDAISWIERNPSMPADNVMPTEFVMLGAILERQGRGNEAEELYKSALQLQEARAKPNQSIPACCTIYPLLNLYQKQGRTGEILPIVQQVLEIQERNLGPDSVSVADTLIDLAGVYSQQGKNDPMSYVEAAGLYKRAVEIQQKNMGSDHPELINTLASYAQVLRVLHDDSSAAQVQAQINAIRRKMANERAGSTSHIGSSPSTSP
jgi:tetratricopeptide (TPR) repeat protein